MERILNSIVIVGAGARGYCILDAIQRVNAATPGAWNFLGYIDDDPFKDPIAPTSELQTCGADFYVISIDILRVRSALDTDSPRPAAIIDPSAALSTHSPPGPGLVVRANAVVDPFVAFGRHNLIGMGATIGHDAVLCDYAIVHPGANINGWAKLGEGATVGAGAVVLGGRTVGAGAYVGAGAVVTHDVPPNTTVMGVPAR